MILRGAEALSSWRWAPQFTPLEFDCHHCGELIIDTDFLDSLHGLRKRFGEPLLIGSGYRCPVHNVEVSGTGPRGPHTVSREKGAAADIRIFGPGAFRLLGLALAPGAGFTGVGVSQRGALAARFIHVDNYPNGPDCPRPWCWSYA